MSVWLVSPAFGRLAVSALVYNQRAWMLEQLRSAGVECEALIVADDENLELARERGLLTLEHPNLPLGRKVNAGIQHAVEHGASHVAFVGSDSIYLPDVFRDLPPEAVGYGRWYALAVRRRGLIVCDVPHPTWALNVYPRKMLVRVHGYPCTDHLNKGLDGAIRSNLQRRVTYVERLIDVDQLQTVTLRSDEQITSTDSLERRYGLRDLPLSALRKAGYSEQTTRALQRMFR